MRSLRSGSSGCSEGAATPYGENYAPKPAYHAIAELERELHPDRHGGELRERPYNGAVPDGGSVTFGFNGSWSGSNPVPVVTLR